MITLLSKTKVNVHFDIAFNGHDSAPYSNQPIFANQFASIPLNNTKQFSKDILTLPCYRKMMDGGVQHVSASENSLQA